MSVNMLLAEQRGLIEENILEIDRIHDLISKLTKEWIKEPFSQDRAYKLTELDFKLQRLWGFSEDINYHRYAREYEFKCQWAGRKFKAVNSGKEFIIPDDVYETALYVIEDAFVDVGRLNCYSRFSNVVEIVNDSEETG